nr:LAETG motif-containing sortase-dependent surface protein [Streptomyces hygroscopicus]
MRGAVGGAGHVRRADHVRRVGRAGRVRRFRDGPRAGLEAAGAPAKAGLAQTGGSSATPYVVGGAVALLAVGGGAVGVARRRRG